MTIPIWLILVMIVIIWVTIKAGIHLAKEGDFKQLKSNEKGDRYVIAAVYLYIFSIIGLATYYRDDINSFRNKFAESLVSFFELSITF